MRKLLFFVWLQSAAWGSALRIDLRHHSSPVLPNAIDQTALYQNNLTEWLNYEVGFNLALVTWDIFSMEYKGEISARLLPVLSANLRLGHAHYFQDKAGATALSFYLSSELPAHTIVRAILGVGYFARFSRLDATPLVPGFSADLFDANAMLKFGLGVRPLNGWDVRLSVSTYDELHTYNLNNPFVSLDILHRPSGEPFEVLAYARYRILLGFGRLDDFTVGAGLRWNFTAPAAERS